MRRPALPSLVFTLYLNLIRALAFCLACMPVPLFTTAQSRYDVLITECLPDPAPAVGLPESSFIELHNHSAYDYNLRHWKISNGSSSATIKTDYLLKADSFLILCSVSSAAAYSLFGPSLGLSGFPSLNNESGYIILSTETGSVIHAIHYNQTWYENELKARGGWSLEMADLSSPCTGRENWTASVSAAGGTPGKKNSVAGQHPDGQAPSLLRAIAPDSLNLILLFDEPVDSLSASSLSDYQVSEGIGSPDSAMALPPLFDRVGIHLQKPMMPGQIYTLSVQQILDCSGNEISVRNGCKAGLSQKAESGDIIFNEILFNPPPYGYDYLELYNRGPHIINCDDLFLTGRDFNGNLKDPVRLATDGLTFFPGDYLLLTENADWVLQQYPMAAADRILSLSALPSLPDDQGNVVLLNASGELLDELAYDHHWHSPLLSGESGVSLERIRSDLPTSLASNWTSAAETAGFGTPGYKNSESSADPAGTDFISVEPKVFSPDMDGYRDFCFIQYHLPAAGFIGSISIYDIYGRMVRKLVNNILWGTGGSFRWEGLDDQQNLLPMGHYIIVAELFLPDGTVKKKKLVCVLASR